MCCGWIDKESLHKLYVSRIISVEIVSLVGVFSGVREDFEFLYWLLYIFHGGIV